jgi:hypothetical protein
VVVKWEGLVVVVEATELLNMASIMETVAMLV